jgi:ribose 5-phosphate isomerase A
LNNSYLSSNYFSGDSLKKVLQHITEQYLRVQNQVIGLGSGSTIAAFVRQMADFPKKELYTFIVSSLQIKLEAERSSLNVVDENHMMNIGVLFDGADQIDSEYNMIKGGGGALFKEKILFSAAKKVVILADSYKYVKNLNRQVPVEVHPFARKLVARKLAEVNGGNNQCKLRRSQKGFPFITENGNIIFDVNFETIKEVSELEFKVKSIPGVVEIGLFVRPATAYYYVLKTNGSFDVVKFE